MRMSRILKPDVWYKIFTLVNRHEQIFLDRDAVDLFNRTLLETGNAFRARCGILSFGRTVCRFASSPPTGSNCQR
jgi:hypothetical protein